MKRLTKYIICLGIGVILGIIAERNKQYLINAQFIRDHWSFRKTVPIDKIPKNDKVMVCLVFGQSNAADYGMGDYTSKNDVYNYYHGDLYRAKEPLLGSDGAGSSVWSRLGDILIDSGLFKKVIIVPCARGQTSLSCWLNGDCRKILDETLDRLAKDSITLTHIFWVQGETDNVDNTTQEQYSSKLKQLIGVIRKRQINAPFYVSIDSYFPFNNDNPLGINSAIRRAQHQVIQDTKDTREGPDLDSINLAYYRVDGVHLTSKGLDKLAMEWFKKIKAQQ